MRMEMTKGLEKSVRKHGSVLKAFRAQGFECGLMTEQRHCQQTCMEVLEEMVKRAPHIITSQNIAVNGVPYNLLSMDNWQEDWRRILEE